MVGLLLIFINVCVDPQTYTDEERCALCWMNKKVLEHEIAENQRLRGRFCWPLVFDYSFSIFDKMRLILLD